MESAVKEWIKPDETAQQMLNRLFKERPFLPLPPPLHKLPLRAGNVVEIVGPASSAKTHILMQAAISCILPKEWKGVQYGGLERLAMFVDMDCHFDVLRLSQLLKRRIIQANSNDKKPQTGYDEELFSACMRRFLYIRCYDSFEFLSTLKTMNCQVQKEREIHGVAVHLLMLDSIGAFYWMDRALPSTYIGGKNSIGAFYWMDRALPSTYIGGKNRKTISFQTVTESVVQEIQKLLLVHPMIVLASKTSLGNKGSTNQVTRNPGRWPSANTFDVKNDRSGSKLSYNEYMPTAWQSFVTHRILVYVSVEPNEHESQHIYLTEWLLPSINSSEKFIVNDDGVFLIS